MITHVSFAHPLFAGTSRIASESRGSGLLVLFNCFSHWDSVGGWCTRLLLEALIQVELEWFHLNMIWSRFLCGVLYRKGKYINV